MAQSRKDSRGYALRSGECQRSDGRYSYSYTDKDHNRQVVYATDLISLRKKEQQIRRDWILAGPSALQSIRYMTNTSVRSMT